MTLSELQACSDRYSRDGSAYEVSYRRFRQDTDGGLDLEQPHHRTALLVWLNKWGCRLPRSCLRRVADAVGAWYAECSIDLPIPSQDIWAIGPGELESVRVAYHALVGRAATARRRIGATATAKILFAIRPKALMLWDEVIRGDLGYDGSARSYVEYLEHASGLAEGVKRQCERIGLSVESWLSGLGRPHVTLPKLIDEYYWVTTRV